MLRKNSFVNVWFQLVIETDIVKQFNASVAIDTVYFTDCGLPEPEDCQGAEGKFQCTNGVGQSGS